MSLACEPKESGRLLGGKPENKMDSEEQAEKQSLWSLLYLGTKSEKQAARACLLEFVGTFLFQFFGGLAGTYGAMHPDEGGAAGIAGALGNGLTLWLVISIIGDASGGHVNPAVTIALFTTLEGEGGVTSILYILLQLLGAVFGAMSAKALMPQTAAFDFTALGYYTKAGGIEDPAKAFGLEFIGAFLFLSVIYVVAVSKTFGKPDDSAKRNSFSAFAIGLTITTLALCVGFFSGCAINPARAFGPAIAFNVWHNQWVYWAGPILGGICGANFAKYVLASEISKPAKA